MNKKTSPIKRLYQAAKEIADEIRKAMRESGDVPAGQPIELRLPILIDGTDLRIIIEAGPSVATRNAIEKAQMDASGKPVTTPRETTIREAMALLAQYAAEVNNCNANSQMPGNKGWVDNGDHALFERLVGCVRSLDMMQQEMA